jgi:Protein of unknown function (DUF3987)
MTTDARPLSSTKPATTPGVPVVVQLSRASAPGVGRVAPGAPDQAVAARDELAGWLTGMTAYNDGARAFWLEAYGGRQYTVDRQKLTEPIVIPRFAVSWYGGIQPGRLAEVMRGADDGLLARFIWFWPDPLRFDKPAWPPAHVRP